MVHNIKDIELFLDRVNDEAEEAAQKVFDKYQSEWEDLIVRNKLKGVELLMGNGAVIYNGASNYVSNSPMCKIRESFTTAVSQAQYIRQRATFNTKNLR